VALRRRRERRVEPVEERHRLGTVARGVHEVVRQLRVERREAAKDVYEARAQEERLAVLEPAQLR
jgi:hypothetical protein